MFMILGDIDVLSFTLLILLSTAIAIEQQKIRGPHICHIDMGMGVPISMYIWGRGPQIYLVMGTPTYIGRVTRVPKSMKGSPYL